MARLMNFIGQPGASSPLIQPSPVGIGGLGKAGPAGRGGYGGPGTSSAPGMFESLGAGLALAYDPRYSRNYRSGIGGAVRGLALGAELHKEGKEREARLGMQWQKLQAQIAESRERRTRFQFEMDQARENRAQSTKEAQNRRALLEQDEELTPEAREVLAAGGTAYDKWAAAKFSPPGASKTSWGAPEQMNVGGRSIWAQRSSEGQIKILSNQAEGESPQVLAERQAAVAETLMADETLTTEQRTAILRNPDVWDNYLEDVISDRGGSETTAKPLGTTGAQRMVNDAGEHPDPRWTMGHATEQGYRVVTAAEANRAAAARKASGIVDQLEQMLLSEKPRDPDSPTSERVGISYLNEPGLWNQLWARGRAHVEEFIKSDSRYAEFMSFSEGTIVQLVRALGEVGNLSEKEVATGLRLIPAPWDPPEVAEKKVKNLRSTLMSWTDRIPGDEDDDDMDRFMEFVQGLK